MLEETIQEYRKVLENCFDLCIQTTKSDLIDYYNGQTYCYSFLLSYKLILIVSFPHILLSDYDSIKKNIYKLEYFLLDIEFFENKDADEKIDYNKYSQHEELLSHIKKHIEEQFKKVFCRSVYQGCVRDLNVYLSDINEAINFCTHSQILISLSDLFYLMQDICLPNSLKSFNKYDTMKISAGHLNLKLKKNKKKKNTQIEERNVVTPNSPYLRKIRSSGSGTSNEFESLSIPNVKLINGIFINILEFFFKKINQTNYFVAHCLSFDNFNFFFFFFFF